jgi:hypothetical protein
MKKKNKEEIVINCDVKSCTNNNTEEGKCSLKNINVSARENRYLCDDASSTLCQSFKNSGSIINDNEYEIISNSEIEIEE